MNGNNDFYEYLLIKNFYGSKTAERSKVPLINHIDEGIKILSRITANDLIIKAYCIHPMLQADVDLVENVDKLTIEISTPVIVLAMEYRNIANAFLSNKIDSGQDLKLSPLYQVNQMLIADKVQNRKDFELYHKGTHERSNELDRYFKLWLSKLNVDEEMYQQLIRD